MPARPDANATSVPLALPAAQPTPEGPGPACVKGGSAPGARLSWMLNLLGAALLVGLASRLPLAAVAESIHRMGAKVLFVFAFGLVWIACDVAAMDLLVGSRVPRPLLLHIELVAEAMARLIPAGGLGGEPYRTRRMAEHLGYAEAGEVVLHYRLVHALSGLAFASCMLGLAPLLVPLPSVWARSFSLCAAVFAVVSAALAWVCLSDAPTRAAGWLVSRLGLAHGGATSGHPTLRTLAGAVACKQLAYGLQLAEVWVIFRLLGLQATWAHLVVVAAALAGVATVMFFVPQGLGVSELGVTMAFSWLGLPAWMGFVFGVLRRGRLVFWTLVGLLVYALTGLRRSPGLLEEVHPST